MFDIVGFLILGIRLASVNVILAIGFTLVYGVGKVLNLAHGAFYMITGYIVFWSINSIGAGYEDPLSIWLSIIIGLGIVGLIAAVSYKLLMEPLQEHEIMVLIITFSLALFLESLFSTIKYVYFDTLNPIIRDLVPGNFNFMGETLSNQYLLIIFGSLGIILFTILFIKKTKLGQSIRAVSQDREAAELCGINADRILLFTVVLSAIFAGIAAIFYVPIAKIEITYGWAILTDAFAVVILGGLGSVKGSVVAAYIIGF
ncbi:MAG: branched-chain amino acid ABC transporter permease, partial [Promethearchaeota archaeon]